MTRLTLVLAALACCLSSATAAFSPHNDLPSLAKNPLPTTAKDASADLGGAAAVPAPPEKEPKQQLVITDETEVKLDGQACKFADVPGTASVVALDVAADKKTILKISFKSKK